MTEDLGEHLPGQSPEGAPQSLGEHFARRKANGDLQRAIEGQDRPAIQFDSEGVQSTPESEDTDMPRGIPNSKPNGNSAVEATPEAPEAATAPETAPTATPARAHRAPDTFSLAQVAEIRTTYEEQIDKISAELATKDARLEKAYIMLGKWAILREQMEDAGVSLE